LTNDNALSQVFDILDVVSHGQQLTMESLIRLVEGELSKITHAKAAEIRKKKGNKDMSREQSYAIAASMEEEGELDEISAVASGAAAGHTGKNNNIDDDELIEKVLHYLVTRGAVK
jgi:hypothetical protein